MTSLAPLGRLITREMVFLFLAQLTHHLGKHPKRDTFFLLFHHLVNNRLPNLITHKWTVTSDAIFQICGRDPPVLISIQILEGHYNLVLLYCIVVLRAYQKFCIVDGAILIQVGLPLKLLHIIIHEYSSCLVILMTALMGQEHEADSLQFKVHLELYYVLQST